jgi:CRAL/TRIO domain
MDYDRTGASGSGMSSSSTYDARTLQQISYMISQLSDEEQELAARTNYSYFCSRDESLRLPAVQHMCARYLRSKKQPDVALVKMKETLAFRKEMNVDHLRVALHSDNVAKCETAQKLKSHVEHKAVYVQGYDKEGRSTFIFEPHRVVEYCHEISLKHHVWTLERAIACSKHPDKTINAVINCGEFVAKHHAPPVNLAKDFFKALRSHYTGHVNKIFLVAPPRSVGFLWSVFKPFVSERTKNNVVFVTKPDQLAEFYCESQAKPWMLKGGMLTEDFDVEEYIERPFDTAFT